MMRHALFLATLAGRPLGAWLAVGAATAALVIRAIIYAVFSYRALRTAKDMERHERIRNGLCPVCGYDLRASKERCPECGTKVSAKMSS